MRLLGTHIIRKASKSEQWKNKTYLFSFSPFSYLLSLKLITSTNLFSPTLAICFQNNGKTLKTNCRHTKAVILSLGNFKRLVIFSIILTEQNLDIKWSVSSTLVNTIKKNFYVLFDADIRACIGRKNIMPTIIIGKIDIVLPAIHMIKKFIGICLSGPRAMSHDFCRNTRENETQHCIIQSMKRIFVVVESFSVSTFCNIRTLENMMPKYSNNM